MKTMRVAALGMLALIATVGIAVAMPGSDRTDAPIRFEVEGFYWSIQEPPASAQVSGGAFGTSVDLRRDFGLGGAGTGSVRGSVRLSDVNTVRLSYTRVRLDGERTLAGNVQFGDHFMRSGALAGAELAQDLVQFEWISQFWDWGNGAVKLGPSFGVTAWNGHLDISERLADGQITTRRNLNRVAPSLGLALDIVPHRIVDIYANVAGMNSGAEGWFLNGEAGVKVYPVRNLGIVAAYRRFDARMEERSGWDFVAWSLRGPFVGLNVRF